MRRAASVVWLVSALGCSKPCRDGTILLSVDFSAVGEVDELEAEGAGLHGSHAISRGATTGTVELAFPSGTYPSGQTVTLTLTAKSGGAVVGMATTSMTVDDSCEAPPILSFGPADLGSLAPDLMTPPCNLVTQSGCGASQKCTFDGVSGSTCATYNAGTAKSTAEGCGPSQDDCAAANLCISSVGSSVHVCRQFCNLDSDCRQPTLSGGLPVRCFVTVDALPVDLCSLSCNPVNALDGNQGCPAGLSCNHYISTSNVEVSDCTPYGAGGDGAGCSQTEVNTCKPGFTCVNVGGTDSCRKLCLVNGGTSQCAFNSAYSCRPFGGVVNPRFGVCG